MERAAERFMQLISYNTQSKVDSDTFPSTEGQLVFARYLTEECKKIGLTEVNMDEFGYVTATLASNIDKPCKVLGLLAHMDTSPDASGENVNARLIKNYPGGPIHLDTENAVLDPKEFPELEHVKGHDLLVTDGTTLLGADNKAGIAEILAAMEFLIEHPEMPHGKIRLAFTPDEEVGRGVDHFDVKAFGADLAFTIDGGGLGELEYESFNAAAAQFNITGKSIHTGSAKNKMVNASLVAHDIIGRFPPQETPSHTDGRQGFFHLTDMRGSVEEASLSYIIRDFDKTCFEERKNFVKALAGEMQKKYGAGNISLKLRDQYYNMAEVLQDNKEIITLAETAMEKAGVKPVIKSIRGGTDGARLSFMGLPCPNIFTGGYNFHGPYEFLSLQEMNSAVKVIVNICLTLLLETS